MTAELQTERVTPQAKASDEKNDAPERPRRYLSTAALGFAGAVAMWLAVPPVGWGFLGWIAPVFWLALIRRQQLQGRRPYLMLYAVGVFYFGATFAWIRLPHWSAWFGWAALFLYLAWYVVLFIGLSRVAVHRLRIPLMLAAPVVWTGLELVRAYFATGFLMAALAHTQYRWLTIIQISDLAGAYGLSFLLMFVAACLARTLPIERGWNWWPLAPAAAAVGLALAYGHFRMRDNPVIKGPKVALIQGSIDTEFGLDPEVQRIRIYNQYMQLSIKTLREHDGLELLVWPESMYVLPLVLIEEGAYIPVNELTQWSGYTPEEAKQLAANGQLPRQVGELANLAQEQFKATLHELDRSRGSGAARESPMPSLLLGVDTEQYLPGRFDRFNTSLYLDGDGKVIDFYHKMHPVMFGEYMPLGEVFPDLYRLSPLSGGLSPGTEARAYEIAGRLFAPNICYETVLPHVIRKQVVMLRDAGREPDVLVTQTNDGWFWGSAALDMHLICGVFRALECRKPLLIAANTGISAVIDANGQIIERGPRRETGAIVSQVPLDSRASPYLYVGDWLAYLCAIACAGLAIYGFSGAVGAYRARRTPAPAE